jgi:Uma2 family endonuclease
MGAVGGTPMTPMTTLNEINDRLHVLIPAIRSHSAFRRWARSPQFPERGWISYLDGELHVDLSMERIIHNLIKSCFCTYLTILARQHKLGRYLGDNMMLTNVPAGVSTEPDGMFLLFRSIDQRRVRLTKKERSLEVIGTPDMALDVVSRSSVRKDMRLLPQLYWRAGIREYWRIDSRIDVPQLTILRRGSTRYRTGRSSAGWVRSAVFGKSFRLVTTAARDGMPEFTLEIK